MTILIQALTAAALAAGLAGGPGPEGAPAAQTTPPPAATQLDGLTPEAAAELIAKLQAAQARLRRGEPVHFELLSGASASHRMATVAPCDAFLDLSLDRPFSIRKPPSDNRLWNPHRIVVLPSGPGQFLWDIEVVLGLSGRIERVSMTYRPPPPF